MTKIDNKDFFQWIHTYIRFTWSIRICETNLLTRWVIYSFQSSVSAWAVTSTWAQPISPDRNDPYDISDNKDSDQLVHLCSLVKDFVLSCIDNRDSINVCSGQWRLWWVWMHSLIWDLVGHTCHKTHFIWNGQHAWIIVKEMHTVDSNLVQTSILLQQVNKNLRQMYWRCFLQYACSLLLSAVLFDWVSNIWFQFL